MKTMLRFGFAMLIAIGLVCQLPLTAADRKDKEKEKDKKEEKKKDVPAKDVNIKDELTDKDVKDTKRDQSYCKTFTYKMVEGMTYEILMRSSEFDAYLRLEDPKGNQVAEDDDSGADNGVDLDAKITYKATKSGEYTVICTTYAGGATGKFTLTIKKVPDGGGGGDKDGNVRPRPIRPRPPIIRPQPIPPGILPVIPPANRD